MIQSFRVTNHVGEALLLPLSDFSNSGIIVVSADGIGPVDATINTTDYAMIDGAYFNSARAQSRNINLTLRPVEHPSVEDSRHRIYRYFPIKRKIKMEVTTDRRVAYTEGYVESVTPNIFSDQEEVDISIICPDPYFYSMQEKEVLFYGAEPMFEFPFENDGEFPQLILGNIIDSNSRYIYYEGDFDVGVELHLFFHGTASGISIHNVTFSQSLRIDASKIPDGIQDEDEIIISTAKGRKQVRLLRNGIYANVLNAVMMDSDWIDIRVGGNTLVYTAESGQENIDLSIRYRVAYEGI